MKSLFSKFNNGLKKTALSITRTIGSHITNIKIWDEKSYEKLEAALLQADFGVKTTFQIVDKLKEDYSLGKIKANTDIIDATKKEILNILESNNKEFEIKNDSLVVILLVGVNGSGKTTTAGKLAYFLQQNKKKVMLAACDTFRAAAIEQLVLWGQKTNTHVVSSKYGADPAATAYDAVQSALSKNYDYLIIDTAGRQHNNKALMEELAKIKRSINKIYPEAPQERWLVVDGSLGNSTLSQTKEFINICNVNGIICTKLDGSYRGGMIIATNNEFKIPIYFIGLGEAADDLQPFNPEFFVNAIFQEK